MVNKKSNFNSKSLGAFSNVGFLIGFTVILCIIALVLFGMSIDEKISGDKKVVNNNFNIDPYFWPIGFILAGLVALVPSMQILLSKSYAQQYLINLKAFYSGDYSLYHWRFGMSGSDLIPWVKLFGPEKFYKISRTVFAPLGILASISFICLGLYLISIK